MKIVVGVIHGFLSGFMILMASALLFKSREPSGALFFVTFFGGWALSSIVLVRGARTVSKVFSRGFLLGAAEWLAMIPVGIVVNIRAQGTGTDTEVVAAAATLSSFITGAVSIAMAVVCLIGFAVSYLIGREMKPEEATQTRTCPECAELIKAAARKCKHCGADIPHAG